MMNDTRDQLTTHNQNLQDQNPRYILRLAFCKAAAQYQLQEAIKP